MSKWDPFSRPSVITQYSELEWNNGQILNPDVTITIKDEKIGAHKIILQFASNYFWKLIHEKKGLREIKVPDEFNIQPAVFKNILKFFYTQKFEIDKDNVNDIEKACEKLECDDILYKCKEFREKDKPQTKIEVPHAGDIAIKTTDGKPPAPPVAWGTEYYSPEFLWKPLVRGSNFLHFLQFLWDQGRAIFSDVTVITGGVAFRAHKMILSCHSYYFSDIFSKSPHATEIMLPKSYDISASTFHKLLKFMYTNSLEVEPRDASALYHSAVILKMTQLIGFIEKSYFKEPYGHKAKINQEPKISDQLSPRGFETSALAEAELMKLLGPLPNANSNMQTSMPIADYMSTSMPIVDFNMPLPDLNIPKNNYQQFSMVNNFLNLPAPVTPLPQIMAPKTLIPALTPIQTFNYSQNIPPITFPQFPPIPSIMPQTQPQMCTTNLQFGNDFLEFDIDKVISILSNDNIIAKSEYEIFRAAMNWLKHKPERLTYVNDIMRCIRFHYMERKDLMNITSMTRDWFERNSTYREMLLKANWFIVSGDNNIKSSLSDPIPMRRRRLGEMYNEIGAGERYNMAKLPTTFQNTLTNYNMFPTLPPPIYPIKENTFTNFNMFPTLPSPIYPIKENALCIQCNTQWPYTANKPLYGRSPY
ncbi:unnamed protein product [Gordionus sp. m RMFG-2023]|uniref:uncharacterized protein LOC135927048 n=1 Tax=Gordionus sp. m RMFG-2023 TaxID=3053472 RepID=UPI0030DEF676